MALFLVGSDPIKLKRPSFLLSPNYKTGILVPYKNSHRTIEEQKVSSKGSSYQIFSVFLSR